MKRDSDIPAVKPIINLDPADYKMGKDTGESYTTIVNKATGEKFVIPCCYDRYEEDDMLWQVYYEDGNDVSRKGIGSFEELLRFATLHQELIIKHNSEDHENIDDINESLRGRHGDGY